jgi:hypothetical protein
MSIFKFKKALEEEYRRAGVPIKLCPFYDNCMFEFKCGRGCIDCHGSEPGCKNPQRKEERAKYLNWVAKEKYLNKIAKKNLFALDFIGRVGNMCFRQYQPWVRKDTMTKPEAALIDPTLREKRIEKYKTYFGKIPDKLQTYVTKLSDLTLEREQAMLICDWVEDDFLAVLPMGVMKKMLMTSIALGFLIKRLVPKENKRLMLMMFHSVFKRTLVRKRNRSNSIFDLYYLSAIFKIYPL